MLTRRRGEDWIVLQTEDHGYGVEPGKGFKWADSFCAEMVKGNGPHIAPSSDLVPAYANAPIGRQVPIKSYVGVPLVEADGSLFGTLCAIDPSPQPNSILKDQDLVELIGGLLSTILQVELKANEVERRAERMQAESLTDALTKVYNRRGWDRLLDYEEARCRRHGHAAAIIAMDLDHLKILNDRDGHAAGDAYLVCAANALRRAARSLDVVARLGGDEFGILAVECDGAGAKKLVDRLREALSEVGVEASLGCAERNPMFGLEASWQEADRAMYVEKRSHSAIVVQPITQV